MQTTPRKFIALLCLFTAMLAGNSVLAQSGTYFNAVTNLQPVGYWLLNESVTPVVANTVHNSGSLGTAADGFYSVGALPGAPSALAGDPDKSGIFDGDNGSVVQTAFNPAFSNTVFTVEAWSNPATNVATGTIVGNAVIPGNRQGWLLLANANNYELRMYTNNGTSLLIDLLAPIPGGRIANTWYHVAASYDGTTVSIYINGQPITNVVLTAAQQSLYTPNQSSIMTVGNRSDNAFTYSGYLDEVAVYPNALSAAHILSHYQAGTNPAPVTSYNALVLADNPLVYYRFDDVATPVAINYGTAGAVLNGYYEFGTTPGSAGVPFAGFGPVNQSVNFSGAQSAIVGPAITVPGTAGLNIGVDTNHPVTLVAWVQVPTGPVGWFQCVVGKGDQGYRFAEDNGQTGQPDGNPRFASGNNGDTYAGNNIAGGTRLLNDGNWHLWVGEWNGASQLIYIDGVLVGTNIANAGNSNTRSMGIGIAPDDNGRNFIGNIAHVALFNVALSAAQVQGLFNAAGVAPSISVNPASADYNAGEVATLGPVVATGSAPLTYQWFTGTPGSGTPVNNGGRISGANSPTLTINPVVAADQNTYYVQVNNAVSTATSTAATLTVNSGSTARLFTGRSPTFSVAPGFSYVWSTNGVPVAGATNSTFTLNNVQAANNTETVSAVITGPFGPVNSVVQTLQIVPAPTDAYAVAVLADNPIAYFRMDEASGTIAFDNAGGNNGVYSNATLNAAGFPYGPPLPANTDTAVQFGVIQTSNSYAGSIPIDFGLAPSNSPAQPGNAEFSVEAWINGAAGQHNGGFVTKGIGRGEDGGNEQFTLQNSDVGSSGSRIEFTVTDGLGIQYSVLTGAGVINGNWHHVVGVCDQAHSALHLYVDGQAVVTQAGESTAIKAGNGILSSTVPVSIGAKQSTLSGGNYDSQWTGTVDEVAIYNVALTSNQVQNHYYASGIPPSIVSQPLANQGGATNANEGTKVTLTAAAIGSPTLHYQWFDYNGGSPIARAGATNSSITFSNVTFQPGGDIGSGTWFVDVTNIYGDANVIAGGPTLALINVQSGPPIFNPNLPPQIFAVVGGTAVLAVGEAGTVPITNSWTFNSSPVVNGGRISGATSNVLTISNVQTNDQGNYQLTAVNAINSVQSNPGMLVVENEPLFNGDGSGWTLNNGTGTAGSIAADTLQLTTAGDGAQANSFFFNSPMYVGAFVSTFSYSDLNDGADGITFCVQNSAAGASAVGSPGGGMGVRTITNSLEVEFDVFTEGFAFNTNGLTHEAGDGFPVGNAEFFPDNGNFAAGTPGGSIKDVVISFDGNTLFLSISNETTVASFSTNFFVGDISKVVGAKTAFVGFTGACGGLDDTLTVNNFTYTPIPTMSVTESAGSVTISWPTAIGNYLLQSTPSLHPTSFNTIPGPYNIVNGQYQLVVPAPAGAQFYRLSLQ